MRFIVLYVLAAAISADTACAQVIIVPQDPSGALAADNMNIIPEEKLTLEEAASHPDITVLRQTFDGLQVVPEGELDSSDRDKFLHQRKTVRRIEDKYSLEEVDYTIVINPDGSRSQTNLFETEEITEEE